ncbi:MAG: thioredoxin family protein [Gemmataceae bacterium]|nr:thioredoxin family protein [Gemmataceae bacterium]
MRASCLLSALIVALTGAQANDGPKWHSSVADAFAEARKAHKPVLAVLHCPN